MNARKAIILTAGVALFFGVFFLFPVLMVLGEAFMDKEGGFTLAYVIQVFANPVYLEGLWNALLLGVTSTVAALLIAFPLALLTHRYRFPLKGPLSALILVPLILPPFVGAVGVKQMLGVKGALNAFLEKLGMMDPAAPVDWLGEGRFWGIVIMNALHLYPILYMNIAASLAYDVTAL